MARPEWRPQARTAEIAFKTLTRQFRAIDPGSATVVLLEGAQRVLGAYPESLSAKAEHQLRALGVDLRLGVTVTDIDGEAVSTTVGLIPARTVIWGGRQVAAAIRADLARSPRPEFHYRNKGELAMIGRLVRRRHDHDDRRSDAIRLSGGDRARRGG